ncbi:unnamed protein product, partial [Mesorhabditis belari]|uniref:Uncharacterized protein n=1 Tax=Mesorhabditis belari TaxID=2138241 RepID=A0AAF3E9J3_9BILA
MIIFDARLESTLDKAVKAHCDLEKKSGVLASPHFLIGTFAEGFDIHIAHITKCPLPATATATGGDAASKTVDDQWLVESAEKVIRMLPGGIDLVGILWLSNKNIFIEQRPRLIKALSRIAKYSTALTTMKLFSYIENMVLVNVEIPLGKPQAVVVDVVNRSPESPTKVVFNKLEWVSIVSRAGGRISDHIANLKTENFYNDFVDLLKPWAQRILDCNLILVDGKVRETNEYLNKDPKNKKSSFELVLLTESEGSDDSTTTLQQESTTNWHDFVFDIEIRAAVPVKSKVEFAVLATKQHIIRNMCSRAVLHYESMEVTEDRGTGGSQIIHQMPRPATTTLPYHSSILFSDFLFEADTIEDGQKNMKELLEIEASIEHVDDGWERALEVGEMEQVRAPGVVPDHLPLIISLQEKQSRFWFYVMIIVSVLVLLISIILYQVIKK